jgi:hypothetical protein
MPDHAGGMCDAYGVVRPDSVAARNDSSDGNAERMPSLRSTARRNRRRVRAQPLIGGSSMRACAVRQMRLRRPLRKPNTQLIAQAHICGMGMRLDLGTCGQPHTNTAGRRCDLRLGSRTAINAAVWHCTTRETNGMAPLVEGSSLQARQSAKMGTAVALEQHRTVRPSRNDWGAHCCANDQDCALFSCRPSSNKRGASTRVNDCK